MMQNAQERKVEQETMAIFEERSDFRSISSLKEELERKLVLAFMRIYRSNLIYRQRFIKGCMQWGYLLKQNQVLPLIYNLLVNKQFTVYL